MTKTEPRDYVAEMEFVKQVMSDRSDLVAGYVPYGHVIHLWNKKKPRWPLCGRHGGRNDKRPIDWGDRICQQCLRLLQKREGQDDPGRSQGRSRSPSWSPGGD